MTTPGIVGDGLALTPGQGVDGGATVHTRLVTPTTPPSDDEANPVISTTMATGHVRVPITRGTSLTVQFGGGYPQAGVLALQVQHPFTPNQPENRWQGFAAYGVGGGVWAITAPVVGAFGAHGGLGGSVGLGRTTRWVASTHLDVNVTPFGIPIEGEDTDTAPFLALHHVATTGPAFRLGRDDAQVDPYLQLHFGLATWAPLPGDAGAAVGGTFGLTVGATQPWRGTPR